jgi:hypothetical protein
MNIFTKSNFWNYWMYYLLYCSWRILCGYINGFYFYICFYLFYRYFYLSEFLCFNGLNPLIFDGGILTIFLFFLLLVVYYNGWYSSKLLNKFWLFLRFRAGVLSFRSNNLDYRISSFFTSYDYYYFLSALFVIIANYFYILFILTMSINIRFFFCPIFYNFIPLLKGRAETGIFLSFINGNFIV